MILGKIVNTLPSLGSPRYSTLSKFYVQGQMQTGTLLHCLSKKPNLMVEICFAVLLLFFKNPSIYSLSLKITYEIFS